MTSFSIYFTFTDTLSSFRINIFINIKSLFFSKKNISPCLLNPWILAFYLLLAPWNSSTTLKKRKLLTSLIFSFSYVLIFLNKPKKNFINNKLKHYHFLSNCFLPFNKKPHLIILTRKIFLPVKTQLCSLLRSYKNKIFLVKVVKACWFYVKVVQQIAWEELKMIIPWFYVKSKINVQVVLVKLLQI